MATLIDIYRMLEGKLFVGEAVSHSLNLGFIDVFAFKSYTYSTNFPTHGVTKCKFSNNSQLNPQLKIENAYSPLIEALLILSSILFSDPLPNEA